MHRLLVTTDVLNRESVMLPQDAMRHLKVVRPRQGEIIELFDGSGHSRQYSCGASASAPLEASGELNSFPAAAYRLTLFACVTKGSRWDWTIEKATELGVTRIVPVLSDRCVVRIPQGERAAKRERWRRIAEDAARQSDAKWLPEVLEPVGFKDSVALAADCTCFVGALTTPPPEPLLSAVRRRIAESPDDRSFGIFVGPEGDFTPAELQSLLDVAVPVSFGPTVLRAETAAIFGASALVAALHAVADVS